MRSCGDGFSRTQNIAVYGSRLFLTLSSMAGAIAHINHTKTAIPEPKASVERLSQMSLVRMNTRVAARIVPSNKRETNHVQSKNTFLPIKQKTGSRVLRQTRLPNLIAIARNRTASKTQKRIGRTSNVESVSNCEPRHPRSAHQPIPFSRLLHKDR